MIYWNVLLAFEFISSLEGHENEVKSVSWDSTGGMVSTCGRDKSVWIWESKFDIWNILLDYSRFISLVLL